MNMLPELFVCSHIAIRDDVEAVRHVRRPSFVSHNVSGVPIGQVVLNVPCSDRTSTAAVVNTTGRTQ